MTDARQRTLFDPMADSGARLSPCETYRYLLWRRWGSAPPLGWVMLNPSTADATENDPTIRRCIAFARRGGFGGIFVANLFALRATDPRTIAAHADPVGPENMQAIVDLRRRCRVVVMAWGAYTPPRGQVRRLVELIDHVRLTLIGHCEMACLGRTGAGAPRHPLYVRADQPLVPWGAL